MHNRYEIRGETTVVFIDYKGKVYECLIDTEDIERLKEFPNKWFINHNKPTDSFYAVGRIVKEKIMKTYPIHHWILDVPKGMLVDHLNHNGLDNRKRNLRIADKQKNGQNRKKATSNNSTGLLGVSYFKRTGKYTAQIKFKGKKIHLGYFNTKEEAHEVYLKFRKEKFNV